MQVITNRQDYRDRGWKDEGFSKSIQDWENGLTIRVTLGGTTKDTRPVVAGYKVELYHNGNPFIDMYMFDSGRDDEYYATMHELVLKYQKTSDGVGVYGGRGKAGPIILKMKEVSCKFAMQYCANPIAFIWGLANDTYSRGTENGKYQLQEAMKKLLNVE